MNEIWTADLMNGPEVGGRACHLAGIIDDHSRFLTGHQFVRRPDAVRFAGVLRAADRHATASRQILYTDNGSCFADASLQRTCAVLGIRLVHSQPGRPMGRGKIERVFETIQQQFLVEVTGDAGRPGPAPGRQPGRAERPARPLGPRGLPPAGPFRDRAVPAGPVRGGRAGRLPDAALLREAFSWSAVRLVRKTATVALEGNRYSVDPFLAGRKVELVFDPFDMTRLDVYWAGRKVGTAVPQVIGRHAHPKAPPDEDPEPVAYTGIDYLGLIAGAGQAAAGERLHLSNIAGDAQRRRTRRRPGQAVSAPAMPAAQLACLLQDTAAGICADAAAAGLLIRHGHFLHQPGFRRIIAAGQPICSGEPPP